MKTLAICATLAVASLLAMPAAEARTKLTGEQQLAKMLDGREAGKPVSCIPYSQTQNTTVIDKTAIVYRVGSTLYVNRPTNVDRLDDDDVMVTRLYTSQLCRLDTVQLHDRNANFMWNGFVGLQDFVPYKKVASAN
ncbi:hypothetical protein QUC32_24070 [Novosphingobium resinovorum]|jgi:hypothetical protein|uniref:Uncharacterized protein n=1 Tax=Novosphingobium resinovorum TaxID=158500 RepID=A0A031JUX9_9SPHN|nr:MULTISPECIES: hypothetical protein [Sphingomonadaceae]AOR77325.1 hypothetical protein BES08_11605 [Novosphingobium resinovorum]EJU14884.1 hypothetical protein LH128_01332 [Sphingomonas sp. LH128]EZP80745.1 hypothetical protein BV97_03164 [Novosphingobium resinovorum]MBF7012726.1 hypothetical protein [Novosphingobium sp. HR1a]WJM27458.1 hypothetical protein QUC32_24070 [Novosphingobium resinovorum]